MAIADVIVAVVRVDHHIFRYRNHMLRQSIVSQIYKNRRNADEWGNALPPQLEPEEDEDDDMENAPNAA